MQQPRRSSRVRFKSYLARRREPSYRENAAHGGGHHGGGFYGGSPRPARKPTRSFLGLFKAYLGLLEGHRRTIVASLATLSIAVALGLLLPLSSKIAIDDILTDSGQSSWLPERLASTDKVTLLWMLGGAMLAVTAGNVAFGLWGRWQCTRLTKRVQVGLRRRVFEHASRLPLHRIHEMKSGGVASILREDAGGVGDLIFTLIYNPWRAITQLTGTMLILAAIDWKLLLGAVAVLPLIWTTHKTWISRIRPMYRDIRDTRQAIDAQATEAFGGMRVVRGFNRRQAEAARFTRQGHFMARQELLTWWWSRGIDLAWQIIVPLASVGVLIYGGSMVLEGRLTIGLLMAFSAYLLMLLGPLEALVASATSVQNNLAGLDRLLDLLAEPTEFEDTPGTIRLDRSKVAGRITLEGVCFAYPTRSKDAAPVGDNGVALGELVLEGITLDVEPGETIALVGPSGAGKTTLCNLIARFYDPTEGRVLIDGIDLREVKVESYRSLLGIVEQDVFLFDGSVAQNIGYARRHASMDDIERAARAANAHGFIDKLEDGYDTLIGERGVRLSGGQKQRLAIARALLADPRILILDEATSSLDTESERLIQQSLGELMADRTSFVIAHRLSTIRHADRIVVIEDGRIVEVGTHDELLARQGRYAEVLAKQLEGGPGEGPVQADPLLGSARS